MKAKDIEYRIDVLNSKLKNINLKLARRYNYWAIDIYDKAGNVKDTFLSGLTLKDVDMIVYTIARVLKEEGYI
jgi:hypothetical protein